MLTRLPLRSGRQLWQSIGATSSHRDLHLEASEAASFLSSRLPGAHISNTSSVPTKDTLAILLHADRRPQKWTGMSSSERPFFGPSFLACRSDKLGSATQGQLGKGDLGLLRLEKHNPDDVIHAPIRLEQGFTKEHALDFIQTIAKVTGVPMVEQVKAMTTSILIQLWNVFKETEGIWFTARLSFEDNSVQVISPFLEFDDFAVHRIEALKDVHSKAKSQRDSNTAQAEDGGLFYIKLHNGGKVGSFGYGAGNAMATMDGLAMAGATPANFLDGGGGANVANAKLAIETLHRDDDVKSIFVNTFGGLTRCSLVAEGIIKAIKENNITKPMTVRVMGTEAEEANEMLRNSGLEFAIESDFKKAAKLAVDRAKEGQRLMIIV